jgi:hypothetical protein
LVGRAGASAFLPRRGTTRLDRLAEPHLNIVAFPAANLWITDSYPPGLSFKDDNAAKPIGLSPPDSGTAIRVVGFPRLDPTVEAKMDPK